jgi:catechol 2,3-dioxygenase-like lactoylglutathione lyase family enzyme
MLRAILISFALVLPSPAFVQSPPVARLEKLTRAVTSVDKMLPFYRDVLGFAVTGDSLSRQQQPAAPASGTSFRVVTLEIPNATFELELIELIELIGSPPQPSVPRAQDSGVTTLVLNVRDPLAMIRQALSAGATLTSTRGSTIVVLRDADGFFVQLEEFASVAGTGGIVGASLDLSVANADKSVEFLRKAIGFEGGPAVTKTSKSRVLQRMGLGGSVEWRVLNGHLSADETANFGLNDYPGLMQRQFSPAFQNLGWSAFGVIVGDIASATEGWIGAGGTVVSAGSGPVVQPNGTNSVFVMDIDGFTWELIELAPE